ncbi:MAG: c-type cytochrome [Saprospiraceae bacterium]|nr:c-type cytochrome [Saprospiraceae bacterium]
MKKSLKIIGIALGAIIVLIGAVAAYIHFTGIPSYEVNAPELTIEADSARIARGEYLVTMVCAECHRGQGNRLEGKRIFDIPEEFGEVWSPNITHHPESALTGYTDGELVYFLRTGIKRNGKYVPPYMPKFPLLSDEDMASVVAYLRSDAPPLRASDKPSVPTRPSFMTKALSRVVFKPLPFPEEEIIAPPKTDKVAYGQYIATGAVECFGCHSADFTTNNLLEPEKSAGYMGGGNTLLNSQGEPVLSANITMHPEHGLAGWTEAQFMQAVRFGKRPDGIPLSDAMPTFTTFTDEDLSAVWAYLQTVPQIDNDVPRNFEQK